MILIDDELIQGIRFRFYDGLNFDWIKNFAKNGQDGFAVFFIDSWISEVKRYERTSKIDTILEDSHIGQFDINDIQNEFVSIYQLNGIDILEMKSTIKTKIENNLATYAMKRNLFDNDEYH